MAKICRLCLNIINRLDCITIVNNNLDSSTVIKGKLQTCVPEIDVGLIKEFIMCNLCIDMLNKAYEFRCCCLQSQNSILDYIKRSNLNGPIELLDISSYRLITETKTKTNNILKTEVNYVCDSLGTKPSNKTFTIKCDVEDNIFSSSVKTEAIEICESSNINSSTTLCSITSEEMDFDFYSHTPTVSKGRDDHADESSLTDEQLNISNNQTQRLVKPLEEMYSNLLTDNSIKLGERETNQTILLDKSQDTLNTSNGSKIVKKLTNSNPHKKKIFSSNKMTFNCTICNYDCSRRLYLKKHLKFHAEDKPFKCVICSYKTLFKANLQRHIKTHTGEKSVKCDLCDYECVDMSRLRAHKRIHTGEKPFKCNICNYKCSLKSNLQVHIRIHTGEKPFKCDFCSNKYSHLSSFQYHLQTHTGVKNYRCVICSCKFPQKSQLQEHIKTHSIDDMFKCDICSYTSFLKTNLQMHMRTHTGEKPFSCGVCNYKASRKSHIESHIKIHTGEKSFKCEFCNYNCSSKSNLQRHMRIHSGGKLFNCKIYNYEEVL